MAVIRVHKTADYTVMSNSHFREKRLSFKAKGILSQMLSLPDNWDYSIAGLATLAKDGKESVMSGLDELEELGYLKRTRVVDEKGRFAGYDYDIFETPQFENTDTENPCSEKPNMEKPYTEKPPQSNNNKSTTNKSNNKQTNTNKDKKESKSKANSFDSLIEEYSNGNEEIKALLGDWLKVRKAKRAAMTDRAIQLNLEKLDRLAAESGLSVADYLKEVICRGWQAFFKINNYNQPQKQGSGILDDFNRMEEKIKNGDLF